MLHIDLNVLTLQMISDAKATKLRMVRKKDYMEILFYIHNNHYCIQWGQEGFVSFQVNIVTGAQGSAGSEISTPQLQLQSLVSYKVQGSMTWVRFVEDYKPKTEYMSLTLPELYLTADVKD